MKSFVRTASLVIYFLANLQISWCQSMTSIVTNGGNRAFACMSGGGILRSDDGGIHWHYANKNISDSTQGILLSVDNHGNIYAATGYSNIYYSANNGDDWVQSINGLPMNGGAYCLSSDTGGRLFFGNNLGLFRQTSLAGSWTKVSNSLLYNPVVNSMTITDTGRIFISSMALGPGGNVPIVYSSTDHGDTWARIDSGRFYYGMAHISEDTIVAGGYRNGLYRSTNGGSSWSFVGLPDAYIVSFAVDRHYVYIGSNDSQGVFRMLHAGDSLHYLATSPAYVHSLVILQDSVVLAGTSSGLYASADNGQTWNHITTPPSSPTLVYPANGSAEITNNPELSWNPVSGAAIYRVQVSTDPTFSTTVFDSSNVTNTFVNIPGLSGLTKYYWRVNATNSTGTGDWSSTWSFTTGAKTAVTGNTVIPQVTRLYQNYPNPSNPTTAISFELSTRGTMSLKVYDLLGRELVTLFEGEEEIGRHSVEWDGSNVPSGVYFYRLKAGGYVLTKKMMLLK